LPKSEGKTEGFAIGYNFDQSRSRIDMTLQRVVEFHILEPFLQIRT
jgi:hypothetical protein